MRYQLIIFTALMLVILIVYLSTGQDDIQVESRTNVLADQDFDYFMSDFETTRFLPDSSRQFHLRAERLTHFPDPEHTRLDQPRITLYPSANDAPPWHIRSVSARIEDAFEEPGQRIDFMGDVVITREDNAGRIVNIYTEFLSVYPQSHFASTDEAVSLISADSEVHSVGMRAALATNHIELLADVRGHYE